MKNYLSVVVVLLVPLLAFAQTVNPDIENITPDSRYTLHDDGTVADNETRLMWLQCSEGQVWEPNGGAGNCTGAATTYTWSDALTLTSGISVAGYSDWRLPNIKELSSLVAEDRLDPAINLAIFPATPSSSFWSGSPEAGRDGYSWTVEFEYGADFSRQRNAYYHVRLVRHLP